MAHEDSCLSSTALRHNLFPTVTIRQGQGLIIEIEGHKLLVDVQALEGVTTRIFTMTPDDSGRVGIIYKVTEQFPFENKETT